MGWQQIGDSASGACVVQGKSLGSDRALLPPLPIADVSTGVVGALNVLIALREQMLHGGSYTCIAALVKVQCFVLDDEVGLYSQETVDRVQKEFGWLPITGYDAVLPILAQVIARWKATRPEVFDYETSPLFSHFDKNTPYGTATTFAPIARLSKNKSFWVNGPRPYCNDQPTFA